MKNSILPLFLAFAALALVPAAQADWQSDFSTLLAKYAKSSGVDYDGLAENSEDRALLNSVTEGIASSSPSGSKDAKLAWYLNAYNAWILQLMLEKSPKAHLNDSERDSFFNDALITIAGKEMSFNDLENGIIRPVFNEPRIHFALNCAAASCPPLRNEAFTESKLDVQLTEQTKAFVNDNPAGVVVKGRSAKVSQIFNWFSGDFGDVTDFIDKYRDEPLPSNAKISYLDYDWKRNDA